MPPHCVALMADVPIRMDIKQIVSGLLKDCLSFFAAGKAQWFHGFDFKWFDDGLHKFHPCIVIVVLV
jgi:hypothetical protein